MAIAGYTKTTYVNDTTPAINATNLNNIEQQVKDISDAAVNGGASPTIIWTDTNSGNGSQPPAPKPRAATDSDIGQWKAVAAADNTALVLPAGGSWAYYSIYYVTVSGFTISAPVAGVAAGGTTILSALANYSSYAFIWRQS